MNRGRPLFRNVRWRRVPIASLVVAAGLLPALASISGAQTAGDAPSASARAAPVAAPRTRAVWLNPSAVPPPVVIARTLPDPPPLVERNQWVYDLRYAAGDLYLLGIHPVALGGPQATPRVMGRFALELYEGATLIDRARFDFPMLGDVTPGTPTADGGPGAGRESPIHGTPPSFASKLVTRIGVMFPASKRGTKLVIVDRATDVRWPLPWPPVEMTSSFPSREADAGSGDRG